MKKLISILATTTVLLTATSITNARELIKLGYTSVPNTIKSRIDKSASNTSDIIDTYRKGNKSWVISLAYGKVLPVFGTEREEAKDSMLEGIFLYRGKMLCNPSESWMLPKGYVNNYEFLYGPNLSLSNQGFFAGIEGVLTTNIISKDKKLVISPSLGLGVQVNNVYKNTKQSAIGQQFVFDMTASVKVTFPKWDDNLSYGISFNHKSHGSNFFSRWSDDGGAPDRNDGLNTVFITLDYKF